ncbi:MAG: substrate-binding domain-containing protein [Cyanobacteria bacterium P01_A01_bin.114]
MLKNRFYASLAVAVAIAAGTPALLKLVPAHAQLAAATFNLPETVPDGTQLKISSGADSMTAISEALKQKFESDFSGTAIAVTTVEADAAIQDVLAGNADLAAISRPLTPEEEAQGLVAETIHRVKIGIVVGEGNPFRGNLSGGQFASMFRGEITDWSEVGGTGSLIFIDRPDTSDTRKALGSYPVFETAPFESGANTTKLSEDSNTGLADALGTNGVGYILASELEGVPGIHALELHKTLPSDPRYPFSQPFAYVYRGEASPAIAAFLGYATAEPGQAAVQSVVGDGLGGGPTAVQSTANAAGETANAVGAAANNVQNSSGTALNESADAPGAAANQTQGAVGDAEGDVSSSPASDAAGQSGDVVEPATPDAEAGAIDPAAETSQGFGSLRWLFLIPIALTGVWLWMSRGKAADKADADKADVDKADVDKAVAHRADADRADADKAVAHRADADKVDVDRADADRLEKGTALAGDIAAATAANRVKNRAANSLQGTPAKADNRVDSAQGSTAAANIPSGLKGRLHGMETPLDPHGLADHAKGQVQNLRGKAEGMRQETSDKVVPLHKNKAQRQADIPPVFDDVADEIFDAPES